MDEIGRSLMGRTMSLCTVSCFFGFHGSSLGIHWEIIGLSRNLMGPSGKQPPRVVFELAGLNHSFMANDEPMNQCS